MQCRPTWAAFFVCHLALYGQSRYHLRMGAESGNDVKPSDQFELQEKFLRIWQMVQPNGFVKDLENHVVSYFARSPLLIVTFDNRKSTSQDGDRLPWGMSFAKSMNASHLGVMTKRRNDWFRNSDLFDFFDSLRDIEFFKRFHKVIFYGSSMGGFGALTFAAACPNSHIVVMCPQTTLSKDSVPWETRYEKGYARGDWTDPRYLDGVEGARLARRVDVFADPYFKPDWGHVQRLTSANVNLMRLPFQKHSVPNILTQIPGFTEFLRALMLGTFDDDPVGEFRTFYRARHDVQNWVRQTVQFAIDAGRPYLAKSLIEAAQVDHPDWTFPRLDTAIEENFQTGLLLEI